MREKFLHEQLPTHWMLSDVMTQNPSLQIQLEHAFVTKTVHDCTTLWDGTRPCDSMVVMLGGKVEESLVGEQGDAWNEYHKVKRRPGGRLFMHVVVGCGGSPARGMAAHICFSKALSFHLACVFKDCSAHTTQNLQLHGSHTSGEVGVPSKQQGDYIILSHILTNTSVCFDGFPIPTSRDAQVCRIEIPHLVLENVSDANSLTLYDVLFLCCA